MKGITRSRGGINCSHPTVIWEEASRLLSQVHERPIRLIGVGLYNLTEEENRQLTFEDIFAENAREKEVQMEELLAGLSAKYKLDFAGHLDEIFQGTVLYRTIEYMRKHRS